MTQLLFQEWRFILLKRYDPKQAAADNVSRVCLLIGSDKGVYWHVGVKISISTRVANQLRGGILWITVAVALPLWTTSCSSHICFCHILTLHRHSTAECGPEPPNTLPGHRSLKAQDKSIFPCARCSGSYSTTKTNRISAELCWRFAQQSDINKCPSSSSNSGKLGGCSIPVF